MSQDPVDVLQTANAGMERLVLDNGRTVLLKEDRSAPLVAIQYWVGAGSIHEDEFLGGGLSHYLEHMVFKGTETRSAERISLEVDRVGGDLNARTDREMVGYSVRVPDAHFDMAMDLLADMVSHPALAPQAVETERQVEAHLASHLTRLPQCDLASRAIVTRMKDDEARHAQAAQNAGAAALPAPVQGLMRLAAKVMTTVAHRI